MTYKELSELMETMEEEYDYVGLRFQKKVYSVGETIEDSRANDDREDERDFPQYGTEEYNNLPVLLGVSTWHRTSQAAKNIEQELKWADKVYIVVGNDRAWYDSVDEFVLDDNEYLIEDGKVAVILK